MQKVALLLSVILNITLSVSAQKYHVNISEKYNNNLDKLQNNERLRNAVDTFLKYKNKDTLNQFCIPSDQKLWGKPFKDLMWMEYYFVGNNPMTPTILGAIEVDSTAFSKKYLMKIAYTSNDDSIHNSVVCVYNFFIQLHNNNNGFSFERYTNHILSQWHKKQVGNILYYKASEASFNMLEAKKMNSFNDSIAKLFKVDPLKCAYFSCRNPIELFQLKGFDYVFNMFLAKTGGQAVWGGEGSDFEYILYSGNNKEFYPHEICHFYINKLIKQECSRLAEEGIATFLGGSSEQSYSYHARALKLFLDKSPNKRVFDLFSDNSKINEHTSMLYATGAVIADMAYEKKGLEGFRKFLAISEKQLKEEVPKIFDFSSEKEFEEAFYKKLKQYD